MRSKEMDQVPHCQQSLSSPCSPCWILVILLPQDCCCSPRWSLYLREELRSSQQQLCDLDQTEEAVIQVQALWRGYSARRSSASKPPPSTSQLVRLGTARCLSRVAAVLEEGGSVELLSAQVFGGDMVQASIFSQNISSAATILDLYLGDLAARCTGCRVHWLSSVCEICQ